MYDIFGEGIVIAYQCYKRCDHHHKRTEDWRRY